jgi:hypothetical protein
MGEWFRGYPGSLLATACRVACPPDGSDRTFRPANGDFYSRASDESVALFVVGYNQKNLNHAARIELALSYDHITTTMDR